MLAIKNRQEKLAASQLQQFQLQPQEQKKIRKKEKLASIEMLNKITLSNPDNTQEKKFNYSLYDNCDTSNPFVSNCENAYTNERNIALKFSSQNDLTSGQDTGNVQLSATSVDQMENSTNALYNTKENLSSLCGHIGRVAFKASKENISISPEDIASRLTNPQNMTGIHRYQTEPAKFEFHGNHLNFKVPPKKVKKKPNIEV
ncbi:hypothetical protein HK099_001983, partial [Clydaea vesicula]